MKTDIAEYELARKRLLTDSASGGLVALGDRAPAYLPMAGNDCGRV